MADATVEQILSAGRRQQQKQARRQSKLDKFFEFAAIFGDKIPLFIPSVVNVKERSRTPMVKWRNADASIITDEFYVRCMREALMEAKQDGCIQVKLGPDSFNLCALDVDADELVQLVLDAMPFLAKTLQTRGSKGRHFWVYMEGDYPQPQETDYPRWAHHRIPDGG